MLHMKDTTITLDSGLLAKEVKVTYIVAPLPPDSKRRAFNSIGFFNGPINVLFVCMLEGHTAKKS